MEPVRTCWRQTEPGRGGDPLIAHHGIVVSSASPTTVFVSTPQEIFASTDAGDDAFAEWQRWPAIPANLYGNLFLLPADELARATPRLIQAGGALCLALQRARFNRAAFSASGPKEPPGPTQNAPGRGQQQTEDPTDDSDTL